MHLLSVILMLWLAEALPNLARYRSNKRVGGEVSHLSHHDGELHGGACGHSQRLVACGTRSPIKSLSLSHTHTLSRSQAHQFVEPTCTSPADRFRSPHSFDTAHITSAKPASSCRHVSAAPQAPNQRAAAETVRKHIGHPTTNPQREKKRDSGRR